MDQYYNDILTSIPPSIDFNFIPALNETTKSLKLTNTSNVSIFFTINSSDCFIFEPTTGIIPKQSTITIIIKAFPKEAKVTITNAKIILDSKASKIIKLSSISKFPYLSINKTSLDFGVIQIGKSTVQELIISNPEQVPAKFTITKHSHQPGKHPELFLISNSKGEIPPQSSFLLKVKYQTHFADVPSYDTFNIKTQGGNTVRFSCSGSSFPLSIWLSSKYVNFKLIPLGNQLTKVIRLYNGSDMQTEFQIFHNNDGVFKFDKLEGEVERRANTRLNITFRPYETKVYYERVFCIVRNHILISIDLYGSCHDLLTKPLLIEQKFIDIFRYKILNGLYFNADAAGAEANENEFIEKITRSLVNKSGKDVEYEYTSQLQLHKELFWESTANTRMISFDTEFIDFRFVSCGKSSEGYVIKLRNNTTENVEVKWILEKPINISNLIRSTNLFNYSDCVFIVQPEEFVIKKQSTAEFKVYFKPNASEFYFYADITCQAHILKDKDIINSNNKTLRGRNASHNLRYENNNNNNNTAVSLSLSKKKLKPLAETNNSLISSFALKGRVGKTMLLSQQQQQQSGNEYFDPPMSMKLNVVGHSFPPGNQIFIPIYEFEPSKEVYFPPSTLYQSMYQTIKITNKSDTPLFYNISSDPSGVFRVHRKCGLIPGKEFHLICIEFTPKDNSVYRYPLRIVLNHDTANMKTLILNALSVNPVIELEGIKDEIYFPPSYVGITTTKKITVINRSPVKVTVNVKCENDNANGLIDVKPNTFEMSANLIKDIELSYTPLKQFKYISKIIFSVDRIYDSTTEQIGVFNPGSITNKVTLYTPEKRTFIRDVMVLGSGSDGEMTISPTFIDFGTVKVGFLRKVAFTISNPTITNFYIKLDIEPIEDDKKQKDAITFDFTEGLINAFCKKDVHITFQPVTRSSVTLKVKVFAIETPSSSSSSSDCNDEDKQQMKVVNKEHSLKCELMLKANGDYPLMRIADIRNNFVGTSELWHSFNVDEANEELSKQLTDEEINYMSNEKDNKKIHEITDQLKTVKFDFGKHIKKKSTDNNNNNNDPFDVFLTLRNEGGVPCEFFFKFSDDIAIKREIWMDPVEPTSNDKLEYHVLKEKIFQIEPRKNKLEPNECCNIRLRYNRKETGEHRLRVIFQIVNGKPLICELVGQCYTDKQGILEIKRPTLDFSYVPIGYMDYIVSPLTLSNVGGVKIRYKISQHEIDKFNEENNHFVIFKVNDTEGSIGPGDLQYLPVFFRPLTSKQYTMKLLVHYTDEINGVKSIPITIQGKGYHPIEFVPPKELSPFHTMPKDRMCNVFDKAIIQKCGVNVEEIDFGVLDDTPISKTFILYNYSKTNSFTFDIREPGFILKDEITIRPNKDKLDADSHTLVKMTLTPKGYFSNYSGEIEINITWNAEKSNKVLEKEKVHLRIHKKNKIKEKSNSLWRSDNDEQCFIETMLSDLTKEILCESSFEEMILQNIEHQPNVLYQWTSDVKYPSQDELRTMILANYIHEAKKVVQSEMGASLKRSERLKERAAIQNDVSRDTKGDKGESEQNNNNNALVKKDKEHDVYGEDEDLAIQEKYMMELLDKYKMKLNDVNEALAVVNEESRKLISDDIMEATIYNIISEAVYGEADLTEKTRIYFFNK